MCLQPCVWHWLDRRYVNRFRCSFYGCCISFAILRSRKLNLKGGLAPILEIESGSNDPVAYMMTMIFMSLLSGAGDVSIPVMLAKQLILVLE